MPVSYCRINMIALICEDFVVRLWNLLVVNMQEKLEQSLALLEQYKNGTLPAGVSDRDLWQALKVKQVWHVFLSFKVNVTEDDCYVQIYFFLSISSETVVPLVILIVFNGVKFSVICKCVICQCLKLLIMRLHLCAFKGKGKGQYICIAPYCRQPTSKALRYGNALSRDLTVLPAHPHVFPRTKWTIPACAFPAEAGTHLPTPKGWKAELAFVKY